MKIADRVLAVQNQIALAAEGAGRRASDVTLLAASKTFPSEDIRAAFAAGITVFGENRVQEMVTKAAAGAYEGATLHFIGRLQKNKVKKVVGLAALIQSVDSIDLLELISRRAVELGLRQEVLLEINIAGERSKSGIAPPELPKLLDAAADSPGVFLRGLMAIPPAAGENGTNRRYFSDMYQLFVDIGAKKYDNVSMDFLSMGMSSDFTDAIAEGANLVRVGSAIFGSRRTGG